MRDPFYDSREWLAVRYEALKASTGRCSCCGQRPTANNPIHVEARLVAAFNLSDEERKAPRDLLDRSICGSTHEEREAARRILDAIEAYARSAFEERGS